MEENTRKVYAKHVNEDNLSCNKRIIDEKDLSYKERMEDAQASGAEEGRDKLRKAAGSCK